MCIQGYVKKGNSCVYGNNCLNGGTLDPYTGFCVCSLSILQYNENFGCACKDPNAYFDAASQTCQCTGNSVKIGGLCVQCWQFSVVSANGLTCACIKGYILNQQGNVCVSAGCTGTAMYNSATGQC